MPALAGGSPFYVLLFLWSFARLPRDLIDAARLDGAGPFEAWRSVAMPLVRPTSVAVAMLAFIAFWGNFIDPLLFVQSIEKQTLPYGLHLLHQLDSTNWPLLMAAAVMTTAPTVAVFLALQRYFLDPSHGADWFGR
jgi:multiple sugar transport system permease protein